jgi:phospholipid-binding lipoprotein MlaA
MPPSGLQTRRWAFSAVIVAILGLSACGPAPAPSGINDPYEKQNRETHKFNQTIDKNVIRPIALGATVIPKPISKGVANFGDNLGLPNIVINDLLQARFEDAVPNALRFVFNTTIGIGGILDPATKMGLPEKPTDFGQTLQVWGVSEGAYVELPILGPSTERDATGKVVDFFMDPTRFFVPGNKGRVAVWVKGTARVAARIDERGRYSETYDSILYGSADSYAQARLLYLENRRHNLGQAATTTDFEDPYAQ